MNNIIQTFDNFNFGMRRPDREEHLRLCGFEYKGCFIIATPFTPKLQAKRIAESFNESKNKPCHVVYWVGSRNMDGERGYQYWIKAIEDGE